MHGFLSMLQVLSTIRVSVLSVTIFFLIQGVLGIPIPYIMLWLNICLFFIFIHLITEIVRYIYVKDTVIINSLFLAGIWIVFIDASDLDIFIVDNTFKLQTFINAITLSIMCIYLYQNLSRLFSVFRKIKIGHRLLITLSFLLVIAVGTVLLKLPISTVSSDLSLIDAFFTAVSAVCVTGLVVVDTATYFSRFGQMTIMFLVQIGSLGLVTITTTMVTLLGRRLSVSGQISAKNSISASNDNVLVNYLGFTLGFTFIVEFIMASILFIRFYQIFPLEDAIFYSIFHAVTAFCNAGFSLFSDSLVGFRTDPIINFVIMGSIFIGGLGFGIWLDLKTRFIDKKTKTISLQTAIALFFSIFLVVFGTVVFFFLEKNHSLVGFSTSEKIISSLFASVNLRTAGFNSIDLSQTNEASRLFSLLLMYVGASPGSTGGGIKTTTFLVLCAYVKASLSNSNDITIFGKRVRDSLGSQAWSLVFHSLSWIFIVTLALCYLNGISLSDSLYETVSAYATVGVSTGITGSLTNMSKILISITMILGRIGPTTIMLVLIRNTQKTALTRTPAEKLSIG